MASKSPKSQSKPKEHKVQLKVFGSEGSRSRCVKVGDFVHILAPFDKFELGDISSFPAPRIVEIIPQPENVIKSKRGQYYQIKVQFQTPEKTTHQAMFWPSELQATIAAFLIGDEVVVSQVVEPLVVPVGTKGIVVGGDGDSYHVSFTLTNYSPPITVSQDFVPAEALTYGHIASKKRAVNKAPREASHTKSSSHDLLQLLSTHVKPQVFTAFQEWLDNKQIQHIDNSTHLQGLVVQFFRAHKDLLDPKPSSLSPAVIIALRQLGASPTQIEDLGQKPDFPQSNVHDAAAYYVNWSQESM